MQGLDSRCGTYSRKYYQQAILLNRQDVLESQRLHSYTDIYGNYIPRHSIRFRLKDDTTGLLFAAADKGLSFTATFDKSIKEGIPQYLHKVEVPLMGVGENIKTILQELDNADLFAAVKYLDNTIEIYGFDFGLVSDYGYDPQGNQGGSVVELSSEALEDYPPYIYSSGTGGDPLIDWDNLFVGVPSLPSGDFNNDFNNDFFI